MSEDTLLYPREVASMFRVSIKTVGRWARDGKIPSVQLPGGHRRYRASEMRDVLERMNSGSFVN